MEITNKQFEEVLKRAFIHGLVCAPFFEDHLTENEQKEKVEEMVDDCLRSLKEKEWDKPKKQPVPKAKAREPWEIIPEDKWLNLTEQEFESLDLRIRLENADKWGVPKKVSDKREQLRIETEKRDRAIMAGDKYER